ncbi:hypothetical protein EC844_12825 [Acinetobacter calcoaceticus]|uniref:Uncharacterized protein n=1 Tax=Acinetobacter calcoaceticus TaxID=471 RepID=A0A4R1XCB2_ACICA|nr:hypothetical protein EC844_12825 [Acinetobacter calcoaceticus]
MMKITFQREACCSQDDQLGPLEIQLEFEEDVTLEQVMKDILRQGFLQYSASHNHMVGVANKRKLVEIQLIQAHIIFHLDKETRIIDLLDERRLSFVFIHLAVKHRRLGL